jgi:BirA family biotin operon repressor/biotin-[acetyl-CoA-carboxylase] ligase
MALLDIDGLRREFPARRIEYYASVDSTMRAAASLEPGAVVLAEEQTAGLGRNGHTWHSEPGSGIYCSMVLGATPVLTLALGLAAQDAIAKSTGIACDLRWPNDVMIGDRKVAGILVQSSASKAIAGIGINVNHKAFPPELASLATSLSAEKLRLTGGIACPTLPSDSQGGGAGASACQPIPREPIIAALLHAAEEYLAYDKPAILQLFTRSSSYAAGRRVEVEQPGGAIRGVTAGLDQDGFLVVRRDDGTDTLIIAGGVRATRS